MKKSVKTITAITMAATMAVSAMSAMAVGASAEEYEPYDYEASDADYGCGDYFGEPLPEVNSFKTDPNAPQFSFDEMVHIASTEKKVGQYDIQVGQYYLLRTNDIHASNGGKLLSVSNDQNYYIVKVTKVYEDPKWYGSERTVEFTFCDTGAAGWVQPNKGFGLVNDFYDPPAQTEVKPTAETSEAVTPIAWLNNECPTEKDLKRMNLDNIVCNPETGWSDTFYDTYRGNGVWQHVGSLDMVKYVGRTLGENDPRYKALVTFYNNGRSSTPKSAN